MIFTSQFIQCFIYTDRSPLTILMLPSSKCFGTSRKISLATSLKLMSSGFKSSAYTIWESMDSPSVPPGLRFTVLFRTKHKVDFCILVLQLESQFSLSKSRKSRIECPHRQVNRPLHYLLPHCYSRTNTEHRQANQIHRVILPLSASHCT